METARTIGWLETPMLKENGAQLSTPAGLRVDTNAIGRGTKAEIMRRYAARSDNEEGFTITGTPRSRNVECRITVPSSGRFV